MSRLQADELDLSWIDRVVEPLPEAKAPAVQPPRGAGPAPRPNAAPAERRQDDAPRDDEPAEANGLGLVVALALGGALSGRDRDDSRRRRIAIGRRVPGPSPRV